jgi:hypothetical protein
MPLRKTEFSSEVLNMLYVFVVRHINDEVKLLLYRPRQQIHVRKVMLC